MYSCSTRRLRSALLPLFSKQGHSGAEPQCVAVVQIDDETDEDAVAVLLDAPVPVGVVMCSTELPVAPLARNVTSHMQRIMLVRSLQASLIAARTHCRWNASPLLLPFARYILLYSLEALLSSMPQ